MAEARRIVFLYNDRDAAAVEKVHDALEKKLRGTELATWMASKHVTWKQSLFDQIEDAIEAAPGVLIFHGDHGMGKFQKNIEMGAVHTKRWVDGEEFGVLVVHVPGSTLETPMRLKKFPSVNYHRDMSEADHVADEIFDMLGAAPKAETGGAS